MLAVEVNDLAELGAGEVGKFEMALVAGHTPLNAKQEFIELGRGEHGRELGLQVVSEGGEFGAILGQQDALGAMAHPASPILVEVEQRQNLP